jgi:hypothetical protein
MRTGQGHFLAGLSGHALEFQVKVKAFAALGALQTIHFPLPISLVEITMTEVSVFRFQVSASMFLFPDT